MMNLLAALLAVTSFTVQVHGKGPAMILIPGLASAGEVWDGAVARYQDRYQLHVLTLAGFVGQPPVEPPLLSRARDELAGYIREHKLEEPVVVGHSLGAFLALSLAEKEPELVGKIVAVDGLPFLPALFDPAATAESARPMAVTMRKTLEALSPEQFAARTRMSVAGMVTAPQDIDRVAGWGARSNPTAVAAAMEELMSTDLRPSLRRLRAPLLLIAAGAGSPLAEKDLLARYQSQVAAAPQKRVLVASKARHFVMLDDPGFLFARMDEFLGGK
jgi:pimeloyl-ACP methyl ester carboxylesterase